MDLSPPDQTKRVLLVDDDADTRDALAELFILLGHQCRTAGTGADALAAIESFRPQILFVDIGLPDMTGHDLAREIRAREIEPARVPIIAVSGRAQPADVERSLESGIDLHLAKPIGIDALRKLVGDATQAKPVEASPDQLARRRTASTERRARVIAAAQSRARDAFRR